MLRSNPRRLAQELINAMIGLGGYKLIRTEHVFERFILFKKTIRAAEKAGLSVGDYIDFTYNMPGTTQLTIDKMDELGVFDQDIESVCEIGPGSGRYLEKTINICHPKTYEIYETAVEWRDWLAQNYPVIAHDADGKTLSETQSHSVDLVQSHKAFPGLRFLVIWRYFCEMLRVLRKDGYLVFDVLTEDCFKNRYYFDNVTLDEKDKM